MASLPVIEYGIPVPNHKPKPKSGQHTGWARETAECMGVGGSYLVGTSIQATTLMQAIRRHGGRPISSKLRDGSGWRVWRAE